jgi:hypothetical protein
VTLAILRLPPITDLSIEVVNTADWRDAIQFKDEANAIVDITGIHFRAQLRRAAEDPVLIGNLDMDTNNQLLVNGGTTGILAWNVPYTTMQDIPPGSYVMDIIATFTPYKINLMSSPATVVVKQGVTRNEGFTNA